MGSTIPMKLTSVDGRIRYTTLEIQPNDAGKGNKIRVEVRYR